MDQLGGDTCITRRENPAFSDVGFRRREGRMATEEAAAPAAPPAEEAPPAAPAEAGAGAGEQEEKVEEEQEPAEVLPPPCFDLDEHKLKVCSIHLWKDIVDILSIFILVVSPSSHITITITSFIWKSISPVCAFSPCVCFSSVFAFPCVCFSLCVLFQNAKGNSIYWAL